jgi:excisionase family DNA binding protein
MEKQRQEAQSETPTLRRAVSVREFADSLGVSFDSAYRKVQSGDVKSVKFGRRVLIPRTELDRILGE